MKELSVIQKVHDLIQWIVPVIERFRKVHKYTLGDRIINNLYKLFEGLIKAKYASKKLKKLIKMNTKLDILRHQSQLLLEFNIMDLQQFKYCNKLIDDVGVELGGWIKQQRRVSESVQVEK
jgi:hypothetical protein